MDGYVVVYSHPLPKGGRSEVISLDPEVTALRWGTAVGGFNGASVGYREFSQPDGVGELTTPLSVEHLGHLQIYAGSEDGHLCYEGRIRGYNQPGGMQVTALTAIGYGALTKPSGLSDVPWYQPAPSSGTEANVTAGTLIRNAIRDAAPLMVVGDATAFQDPGGSYTPSSFNGQYPYQVIDQIVKAGDTNQNQLIYGVYENRTIQLSPRVCPTDAYGAYEPHYRIPFDRDTVDWQETGDDLVGAAAVQYKAPSTGTQGATEYTPYDRSFAEAHGGVYRIALINQSGLEAIPAQQFANLYAARYGKPVITVPVTRDASHPLMDRYGGYVPSAHCRYGQWIQVGSEAPLMVVTSDYDASTDVLTLTASNV